MKNEINNLRDVFRWNTFIRVSTIILLKTKHTKDCGEKNASKTYFSKEKNGDTGKFPYNLDISL